MRQTNKYMRGGTVMIIAAGLGLSSTAFSKDSGEPIKEAVQTVLGKVEAPVKIAEAPSQRTAVNAGLSPMRLRMRPLRITPKQTEKIESARQGFKDGDKANSVTDINEVIKAVNRKNRFEITISDKGDALVKISKGRNDWPGYPATNTDWEHRGLSADMKRGLNTIMTRCAASTKPVYFLASLDQGDPDLGTGDFEVGCVPGSDTQRAKYSEVDVASAYLTSTDLPPGWEGFAYFRVMWASLSEYAKSTPNGTATQDQRACVEIFEKLKKDFSFSKDMIETADRGLESCSAADYNWIRQRENVPVVQ